MKLRHVIILLIAAGAGALYYQRFHALVNVTDSAREGGMSSSRMSHGGIGPVGGGIGPVGGGSSHYSSHQ